ncbi:hypothetical protein BDZ85DRAFT_264870 [Elsinoe ampelina]|uniref:Uncharacterized protein n=1 Tax=Elsinoe ampelina TaxID=302913 RepID=A0A6A6G9N0_9PEZI|nr:hypothetical protein BDZ85DRAFT_264870 [Elsinoe ampelina]
MSLLLVLHWLTLTLSVVVSRHLSSSQQILPRGRPQASLKMKLQKPQQSELQTLENSLQTTSSMMIAPTTVRLNP